MSLTRQKAVAVIVDTMRDNFSSGPGSSMVWLLESQSRVGASMDLKAVIDQTSCFSKTTVINITPLSIH